MTKRAKPSSELEKAADELMKLLEEQSVSSAAKDRRLLRLLTEQPPDEAEQRPEEKALVESPRSRRGREWTVKDSMPSSRGTQSRSKSAETPEVEKQVRDLFLDMLRRPQPMAPDGLDIPTDGDGR